MKYDGTNFDEVLAEHKLYLDDQYDAFLEEVGAAHIAGMEDNIKKDFQHQKADFSQSIISGKTFSDCSLSDADFTLAKITDCTFLNISFGAADFKSSNLRDCTFYKCRFDETVLSFAIFNRCHFRDCIFNGTRMNSAVVTGSDFYATLFRTVHFIDAVFDNTLIKDANFSVPKGLLQFKCPPIPETVCPPVGAFIGWKKALGPDGLPVLIKLQIPANAKRVNSFERKCRCSKAKVLEIRYIGNEMYRNFKNGGPPQMAISHYNRSFKYEIGKIVEPDYFDDDVFKICSSGIHFFMDPREAENYKW